MHRRFAGSYIAVVTTGATTGNLDVVDVGRGPGTGGVAAVAGVAAGDVVGIFAQGNRVVVAAAAGAENFYVVDPHRRRPGEHAMTTVTSVGAGDVAWRFAGRQAAVMAAGAIAGNGGVVEVGRGPCHG